MPFTLQARPTGQPRKKFLVKDTAGVILIDPITRGDSIAAEVAIGAFCSVFELVQAIGIAGTLDCVQAAISTVLKVASGYALAALSLFASVIAVVDRTFLLLVVFVVSSGAAGRKKGEAKGPEYQKS
jgi:hypothetical protein